MCEVSSRYSGCSSETGDAIWIWFAWGAGGGGGAELCLGGGGTELCLGVGTWMMLTHGGGSLN